VSVDEWSQGVSGDEYEAERLDSELRDFDWSVLPDGAIKSVFVAPSGELAVSSLGNPEDPRVVLVPGVTGSKEDFTLLAPPLVASGFYVQSYDLAGQYESAGAGPIDGSAYGYQLFADDMVAFLSDGGPAHVLGYSFAGVVAELVAVARPDLCRSLTLLTAPPQPGQAYRGVRIIGWLSWFLNNRQAASLLIWGIVTNKNRVMPRRLAFVQARFALTNRSSVDDIVGLMKRVPDSRAALAASTMPKLIAVGNHDLWPTALHERFARDIGATIAVYRTGHSPCETAPNQLARDMLTLFAQAEAQA
jgi:pimeloyl-ACP methyl ester carboxylesterase